MDRKILSRTLMLQVFLVAFALAIPSLFNSCGEVEFKSSDSLILSSLSSGGIRINGGDEYTNKTQVQLELASFSASRMYITNDPSCLTGGEWEVFSPNRGWILGQENAHADVFVKFKNADGQESECLTDAIIHDNIPPSVKITNSLPSPSSTQSFSLSFQANDSLSGVKEILCFVNSNEVNCGDEQLDGSIAVEGISQVQITAVDAAGNRSTPDSISWVSDFTPPTVEINMKPASPSGALVAIGFTAFDKYSAITKTECKLDEGAWTLCTSPFKPSALASGSHSFSVKATDAVGFTSSVDSHQWTVDADAPSVRITKMPANPTNSISASFEFDGSDNGDSITKFECQLDSLGFKSCQPGIQYSNLLAGGHTFKVKGIDKVGNHSTPAEYQWIIDRVGPSLAFVKTPAANSNSTRADFTWQATDAVSGVGIAACKLDGKKVTCLDGPSGSFSVSDLSEGAHNFTVVVNDQVGNPSNTISHSWEVDVTAPTVQIIGGPELLTKETQATFAFNSPSDSNATFKCHLNQEANVSCLSPKKFTGLADGRNIFYLIAIDAAGNESSALPYEWVVDTAGPVIVLGPKFPTKVDTVLDLIMDILVTDEPAGVSTVNCTLQRDSGAANPVNCNATDSLTLSPLAAGNYTFKLKATDNLGNLSEQTHQWLVTSSFKFLSQNVSVSEQSNKADILFVVDNSGSMLEEQMNMANRISSFTQKIDTLDWQVALTNTDPTSHCYEHLNNACLTFSGDGNMMNRFRQTTSSAPVEILKKDIGWSAAEIDASLGRAVQLQTNGSGYEQGIRATYRFVQRYATDTTRNFFRDNSHFAVVLISDEDESASNKENKPDEMLKLMQNTFGDTKTFTFHSIIVKPGDTVCKSKQWHTYGNQYQLLSDTTGGIVGSVCEDDYAQQLAAIGQMVQDSIKTVELECTPTDINNDNQVDLVVTLADGTVVTNYSLTGNKVIFDQALPVGDHTFEYYCLK